MQKLNPKDAEKKTGKGKIPIEILFDDEESKLLGFASRIVGQQIAAEPALQALDVTLLEQGNVLTFKRSVQVDGDDPLEITLSITKENRVHWIYSIILLLIIAL